MATPTTEQPAEYTHLLLDSGVEMAVDRLPARNTVGLCFRVFAGMTDEDPRYTGVNTITQSTLAKGTANYTGRALADAFDRIGAAWGTASGRQSMLARVLCLPEFVEQTIDLVAEMLRRPTFPEEACQVAVDLALQDLRHMEDEPQDLLRVLIQRLTLGPDLGRNPDGTPESLPQVTRDVVHDHWRRCYHSGRLQVAVAGPLDAERVARQIDTAFSGFGSAERAGRADAEFTFEPARQHRHKDCKQQYIGLTMPGVPRGHRDFAAERVLLSVLSGGMSGRLFTEVREKQGLVYWVGAWHEQPRGKGVIHLGASTTPARCSRTYRTLSREIERLSEDLTESEVARARNILIAHLETEDDLTRARTAALSDDLFHFSRPIGLQAKLAAIRAVTLSDVVRLAAGLREAPRCVATIGPAELDG